MDTESCNRYRERMPPFREMLAAKNAKVDLVQWRLISSGVTPPRKAKILAERGFMILEDAAPYVA
jgi:hypothetical protein